MSLSMTWTISQYSHNLAVIPRSEFIVHAVLSLFCDSPCLLAYWPIGNAFGGKIDTRGVEDSMSLVRNPLSVTLVSVCLCYCLFVPRLR